ncbi:DUF5107 domain-containing protein [Streptomyces sp. NPDC048639]|uniref:DUF5107 domain-containing protein n=1 Tax=Streptomyces sp. NPDC048639 TaxID=3365581 RepID=UPI003723DF26
MATTVRRTVLTLPGAPVGPENPLPALRPLDGVHTIGDRERAALPADMARQVGYEPLRSVLPVRLLDGYARARGPVGLDALVIENDRLRATVLPGLGGRIHSLHHKPTGRELLYRNPVFQPADFALNGAWYSGGIEWNIGATGHTTLSCAPLHAARVPAPDGGEMLRLWEWERLRDTPFQVDLWLPEDSDFLLVGVRIRNPHDRPVPVYWWSNIAVEEHGTTRVLAPADEAWHFGYERSLQRVPVPEWQGADRTYPLRSEFPADWFYEVPDGARRWIASLDADGRGLVQTSTDLLRGRKLFVWGAGRGGRRWQEWLTEPGTAGYAEIQAGLARTQLEHVRLEAGAEFAWLEAYGPLAADPAAVHGADWSAARAEAEARLEEVLPCADVDAAYAAWLPCADTEPKEVLAAGSGWGALEVARGAHELPGTPFDASSLGEQQWPWLELLRTGSLPAEPVSPHDPGPTPVSPPWREILETTGPGALADYHLGVARWHAGDRAQAARSWECSLAAAETPWALRCLAVAVANSGDTERAADLLARAVHVAAGGVAAGRAVAGNGPEAGACTGAETGAGTGTGTGPGFRTGEGSGTDARGPEHALSAALAREAIPALLARGRAAEARGVLRQLPPQLRECGRFRLLEAQILLAEGDARAARAVFDAGFEVDDLREGDEVLEETWYAIAERLLSDGSGADESAADRAGTYRAETDRAGTDRARAAGDPAATLRARARAEHPLPGRYDYRMRPQG